MRGPAAPLERELGVVMRRGVIMVLAPIALALAPAPAHASSIAFIRDANVWLAQPDGSGQHQVTRDGSAASPYHGVSQGDDGVLIAARGTRLLRLRQNGEPLASFQTQAHDASLQRAEPKPPFDPAVTPDGSKVAYFVLTSCFDFANPAFTRPCSRAQYSASSSFTDPAAFSSRDSTNDRDHPSWVSNARVLLFGPPSVNHQDPGSGTDPQLWFTDPDLVNLVEGELTRAGDKLAVVRGMASEAIRLYSASGPPPATPVTPRCDLISPAGRFRDASWSPDGAALAWAEDNGIWVVEGVTLHPAGCTFSTAPRLLIPGASEPDWGPADINPGSAAPCATPGNPAACPPGGDGPKTDPAASCGTAGNPAACPPRRDGPKTDARAVDTSSPVLSALRLTPRRFLSARSGPAAAAAVGTTISYTLSEVARVTFTIERVAHGRREGRRCTTPMPRNRRARSCRHLRLGRFTHQGKAGANRLRFTGQLRRRSLRRGGYRLSAQARDAADNHSRAIQTDFRVLAVARPR